MEGAIITWQGPQGVGGFAALEVVCINRKGSAASQMYKEGER
jgi:hypothetical protein